MFRPSHHTLLTRRGLQIVLGLIWLLDGVLQFQPYMFTTAFAEQVIVPTGQGQPAFVAVPIDWAASLIAAHPVAWNIPFAMVQTLLGISILVPRTARLGLAASVVWGAFVWFLGEGLGGLASGQTSLLVGAPGAALLYSVLAVAAWTPRSQQHLLPPATWLLPVWTVFWLGGAILQALPGQNSSSDIAAIISGSEPSSGLLAHLDSALAAWVGQQGMGVVVALVALEVLIGIGILPLATRRYAAVAGFVMAVGIWLFGETAGALITGTATDPNSGPIIAVMAVAVFSIRESVRRLLPGKHPGG
jgi:hypothetical protein